MYTGYNGRKRFKNVAKIFLNRIHTEQFLGKVFHPSENIHQAYDKLANFSVVKTTCRF